MAQRILRLSGAHAAVALVCSTFVVIGAWVGARTNYFPALNDFWPLLFQSNMLDWTTRASFANGFFPPGYAVFLRLIDGQRVLASAFWWNLAFGAGIALATYTMARRHTSGYAASAGAALAIFHPLMFSLGLTTGPDAGCVFFSAAGLFLVIAGAESTSEETRRRYWWIAAGLFFLAGMWRYHGLVFAVGALLSSAVVYRRWSLWRVAAGIAACLAILAFLSLLPGASAQLARAQAFGVYEAVQPVNWYHMPRDFPPTVGEVIRAYPDAFWAS